MKPTHNPQFLQSLWRRANAQNVSFFTLYGGQFTFSLNSLVNTKLPTKFLLNEGEGRTGTRSWGVMSIARSVQKLPRNGSSKRGLSSSLLYAARTQLAHFSPVKSIPNSKGLFRDMYSMMWVTQKKRSSTSFKQIYLTKNRSEFRQEFKKELQRN